MSDVGSVLEIDVDRFKAQMAAQSRANAIKAMMAGRDEMLKFSSPRERGSERERQAINWIYRWGWSSRGVIDTLNGATRAGLSSRLIAKGLVKETGMHGGGWTHMPRSLLTLTRDGVLFAEAEIEHPMRYERDATRINVHAIRHGIAVQNFVSHNITDGVCDSWQCEREMQALMDDGKARDEKLPDAVLVSGDDRYMIEVELTAKFGRRLDQFVRGVNLGLKPNEAGKSRYKGAIIITDQPAIEKRYTKAFELGSQYVIWQNRNDRWEPTGDYGTIKEDVVGRIVVHRM